MWKLMFMFHLPLYDPVPLLNRLLNYIISQTVTVQIAPPEVLSLRRSGIHPAHDSWYNAHAQLLMLVRMVKVRRRGQEPESPVTAAGESGEKKDAQGQPPSGW